MGDNVTPEHAMALHLAAIRELFEEAGVLLADGRVGDERLAEARRRLLGGDGLADAIDGVDLRLRTDLLVPLAHWTTPRFMPRRFSTWFFAADLPAGAEATFEGDEVIAHRWVSPQLALDQMADGQIEMWIPTSSTLQRLIQTEARTATELVQRVTLGPTPPARIVAEEAAQVRFAFGAVGGLPGRTGETMLIGRRDLVLADPGDPSDEAIDLIVATVARRNGAIKAIVLTSADPDHAAAAQALAIALEVPVLVAPGAGRYLPYETRDVADGERLPGDVAVHVRLGPGPGRLEIVADT